MSYSINPAVRYWSLDCVQTSNKGPIGLYIITENQSVYHSSLFTEQIVSSINIATLNQGIIALVIQVCVFQ